MRSRERYPLAISRTCGAPDFTLRSQQVRLVEAATAAATDEEGGGNLEVGSIGAAVRTYDPPGACCARKRREALESGGVSSLFRACFARELPLELALRPLDFVPVDANIDFFGGGVLPSKHPHLPTER